MGTNRPMPANAGFRKRPKLDKLAFKHVRPRAHPLEIRQIRPIPTCFSTSIRPGPRDKKDGPRNWHDPKESLRKERAHAATNEVDATQSFTILTCRNKQTPHTQITVAEGNLHPRLQNTTTDSGAQEAYAGHTKYTNKSRFTNGPSQANAIWEGSPIVVIFPARLHSPLAPPASGRSFNFAHDRRERGWREMNGVSTHLVSAADWRPEIVTSGLGKRAANAGLSPRGSSTR